MRLWGSAGQQSLQFFFGLLFSTLNGLHSNIQRQLNTPVLSEIGIANIRKENVCYKKEFILLFLLAFCILVLWKDTEVTIFSLWTEFMLLNCKLWDFQSHKGLESRSSFSGKLFSSYISHLTTKKVTIYFVFWVYILIQNLKWDNHHLNN